MVRETAYYDLLGVPVDHFELLNNPPLVVSVGYHQIFQAIPRDSANNPIAGSFDYAWSSSDESIATVDGSGFNATATGVAVGQANIVVSGAGATTSFPITVD